MERENFGSRLGFILVSAIGIGNVWRFPFVAGQNGGAVFVLFYLLFLVCMGVPVLTMELAVGRASGKSAVLGYKALEKQGSKWHIHGWFCIAGCYLLMMYYTTVSGWMVSYFYKFLTGTFGTGMDTESVGGVFGAMLASPGEMGGWMAATVMAGFLICSFGLQKGLERITKVMMAALLVLIVILAVHSVLLPGAGEGLAFYLMPDLQRAREVGIGTVITSAMNQAFFLWGAAGRRSFFNFCDAAQCFCEYVRGPDLGRVVFSVYDICQLFHGNCRIRKSVGLLY